MFCDVFAGTGVVGAHFKQKGFNIISNDIQYYAYCLNRALVGINQEPVFDGVLDDVKIVPTTLICDTIDAVLEYLNNLDGKPALSIAIIVRVGQRERSLRDSISLMRMAGGVMRSGCRLRTGGRRAN